MMQGYLRQDGRKGIRNHVAVAYLVECSHHVARSIASAFEDEQVQLIGFPGCYPSDYAFSMMKQLCTHPNVGAVLLVSLGCEEFRRGELAKLIAESGRPVHIAVIQERGGTRGTTAYGRDWVKRTLATLADTPKVPLEFSDLIVGTECGGSDGTSGITANPAIGIAVDHLIDHGSTGMFEETCELLGCETHMAQRAVTPELGKEIMRIMRKADDYYRDLEHGSFGGGNITGGLTTIEEKSIGAYAKSGTRPITGLLKPGILPPRPGLYLMDMVNDGGVRFGIPNINDTATVVELIACGCHMVLFSTGRGSVVGSAIAPVIKVCANPHTYRKLTEDMDVDAGRILEGRGSLPEVGLEIFEMIQDVASGAQTKSEALGHQEFILTYKTFEPLGPSCLPI
jgi:altronate dehydratase large subunit